MLPITSGVRGIRILYFLEFFGDELRMTIEIYHGVQCTPVEGCISEEVQTG